MDTNNLKDVLRYGISEHWHPNQDYCIKCKKYLDYNAVTKVILVPCKCLATKNVHKVYQQIHYKCLEEIQGSMTIYEIYKHLGIKLPIT